MIGIIKDPYWLGGVLSASVIFLSACGQAPQQSVGTDYAATTITDDAMVRLELAQMQRLLDSLGYRTHDAPGVVGFNTRSAIMSYQASKGIQTDGRITHALLLHLREDAEAGTIRTVVRPAPQPAPVRRTERLRRAKPTVNQPDADTPAPTLTRAPAPVIERPESDSDASPDNGSDTDADNGRDSDDNDFGGGPRSV